MRNKKGFLNLNNKGFAITSIIYSMLLLFIILMTLTILTLGRKKVLLDKTKNETLGFFLQLSDYPCMVTEKKSNEITIGIGDVVTCKTESFYVISNDGTNIEMLAKYNLNVGDNKVVGDTEGIQNAKTSGFVEFSNTNYWSSTTNYPAFIYNDNSNLYQYVENYAVYLRNVLETPEINASLISYDQMIELGCNSTNNSCANAPEWLHLVSYWTGSAYNTTNIWEMNSSGTFGNAQYSRNNIYGVRPVVSIPTNKVKNTASSIIDKGPTSITTSEPGYTGVKAIVYLDPTDLNKGCTENDVNSDTGTKTGCMKWYAYAEDTTTYTMILDHNTTASNVSWNNRNTQMTSDTTGWNSNLNPRLITVAEINSITGKTGFDSTNIDSWYYFDTRTQSQLSKRPNDYGWLFDRINDSCTTYGCLNNATGDAIVRNSYWTSTPYGSTNGWFVVSANYDGCLWSRDDIVQLSGIRPVITVQKSLLNELD